MPNGLAPHKFSSVKWIATCIGAFTIFITLFVLFLPMLFSTTPGKKILAKAVNNKSGFYLTIDDLSLNWFSSPHARGIHAENTQEQVSFSCQEIISDSPLWKILLRNDFGELRINAPQMQLARPFHP